MEEKKMKKRGKRLLVGGLLITMLTTLLPSQELFAEDLAADTAVVAETEAEMQDNTSETQEQISADEETEVTVDSDAEGENTENDIVGTDEEKNTETDNTLTEEVNAKHEIPFKEGSKDFSGVCGDNLTWAYEIMSLLFGGLVR